MATTMTIKGVHRPMAVVTRVNGFPADLEPAAAVVATVDRYSDGLFVVPVVLPFADYAGLETEWEAGAAVTVLSAAAGTAVAGDDVPTEPLTGAQRGASGDEITIGV